MGWNAEQEAGHLNSLRTGAILDDENHRLSKRIADLESIVASKQVIIDSRGDLNRKQSEHISKLGKQIADMEEKLRWTVEVVKATKSMAETCLEERAEGNGGCGACSICCGESTKRAETAEAERDKLREPKDICPVCMTWSWAPCDEGDEGAEQRGEEWVLCQCCNDSRIAMHWIGRAEKLREAGQAVVDMWDGKDGACVEIRVIEALRTSLGQEGE